MTTDPINVSTETHEDKTKQDKAFTIRGIPPDFHLKWKMICMILDKTMEQFALEAVQEKVQRELEKQDAAKRTMQQQQQNQ